MSGVGREGGCGREEDAAARKRGADGTLACGGQPDEQLSRPERVSGDGREEDAAARKRGAGCEGRLDGRAFWLFAALLAVIYVVTRYALGGLYTPEWAARRVFWVAAAVILIAALLRKTRFASTALGGYLLGLVAGELFGGFRADVPPQYLHYGWLILLAVFAAACALGVWLERRAGHA